MKRKKTPAGDDAAQEPSPSPPRTFKNLRNVDEIEQRKTAAVPSSSSRLTKSQKKKLKLLKGSPPPTIS